MKNIVENEPQTHLVPLHESHKKDLYRNLFVVIIFIMVVCLVISGVAVFVVTQLDSISETTQNQ